MQSGRVRTRSGSVTREPAPYRTAYGRDASSASATSTSRFSRATSCDPFASGKSRVPMPSNLTSSSFGRSNMSSSYSNDYRPSSRYGSTEQLSSSTSYKSLYGGYQRTMSSSAYTSRRAGSVGVGYESPTSSAYPSRFRVDSSSNSPSSSSSSAYTSALSKYRSELADYQPSSYSKYRPETSYSSRSSASSTPTSTSRTFDFRSKTPSYTSDYSSRSTTSRTSRFDRDYKSLSRLEKTPSVDAEVREDSELDSTFQKLYKRYVGSDDDVSLKLKSVGSKSEAESEADDEELGTAYKKHSLRRNLERRKKVWVEASSTSSITPCASPSTTPICSPMPTRRICVDAAQPADKVTNESPLTMQRSEQTPKNGHTVHHKAEPKMKSRSRSKSPAATQSAAVEDARVVPPIGQDALVELAEAREPTAKEVFEKKYEAIGMTPAVIEGRSTAGATSALDRFIRRESLTDALQKKKLQESAAKIIDEADAGKPSKTSSPATVAVKMSVELPTSTTRPPPKDNDAVKSDNVDCRREGRSRVASSIKINGVLRSDSPARQTTSESVRISIQRSPSKTREKSQRNSLEQNGHGGCSSASSAATKVVNGLVEKPPGESDSCGSSDVVDSAFGGSENVPDVKSAEVDRTEQSKSNGPTDDTKGQPRRRRDPTRTLDNLLSSLQSLRMDGAQATPQPNGDVVAAETTEAAQPIDERPKRPRALIIPLLLVTEPTPTSSPAATSPVAASANICIWNQRTAASVDINGVDEDEDDEEDVEEEEEYSSGDWTEAEDEEYTSDCEFSVSQTFSLKGHIRLGDLYPLTESSSSASARVSDFDGDTFLAQSMKEESRGRVDRLFANPPPTFTCSVSYDGQTSMDSDEVHSIVDDEYDDEDEYEDLEDYKVLPIPRPGSSSLGAYRSPSSLTSEEGYDGQTYRDNVEVGFTLKLVDRAAQKESDEESEYYEDEEEEYLEEEEYWDEEEYEEEEDEEEYEEYEEEVEEVDEEEEEDVEDEEQVISVIERSLSPKPMKLFTNIAVENGESESEDEVLQSCISELDDVVYRRPKFETLVPLVLNPVEEQVEEAEAGELPQEMYDSMTLDTIEFADDMRTKDVNVVPTFVRETTVNFKEEQASRFADKKPSTDFARKAVIQPSKLEKANVAKVETKVAAMPKPIEKSAPPDPTAKAKPESGASAKPGNDGSTAVKEGEDKSALRKSALNMKEEDAKRKAAADEKAAAQKARRLGTVSALANKFKSEEEAYSYKRSSRLEPKYEEKPRRTYELVKPVINEEFDKQVEELRQKMKSGANQLQTQIKDLSKGISNASEEAKLSVMEHKKRATAEKASGDFGKADEEKARWKAARDAESAREFARIEAEKHLRRKKIPVAENSAPATEETKPEPKKTIRRIWKPPVPEPGVAVPSFSSGAPKSDVGPAKVTKEDAKAAVRSPNMRRKESLPEAKIGLRETSSSPVQKTTGPPVAPKSDGAAATKIRNPKLQAMTSSPMSSERSSKRYNARRKTLELVNESAQPKTRRKERSRKKKFVRAERDIDSLLGFQLQATFEQLEKLFEAAAKEKRSLVAAAKKVARRLRPTRIYISDLIDIDKIYKASEIRDIIASANLN